MNWIQEIRKCFESNTVFYTTHARIEMKNEDFGQIFDQEVYEVICKGEIIGEYPEDPNLWIGYKRRRKL